MEEKQHDWEAIEREYRAGQLSIREVARQHGLSDTAIRKRAKDEGWERDLTQKVREKVRADLVRAEVRKEHAHANDREIVDVAAARGVEVVRSHRNDLSRLRRLSDTIASRLQQYLSNEAPDGPFIGEKESPVDLIDKLSRALHRVIPLERQAFNLDEPAMGDPAAQLSADQARAMAREVLANEGTT